MSLDLAELKQAVRQHGTVMRVVVADVRGSAPREAGASMLVWPGGQCGSIGGGALELEAANLAMAGPSVRILSLGPAIGQCCGGAVTLVIEEFTPEALPEADGHFLRRVSGAGDTPLLIQRAIGLHRNSGARLPVIYENGWLLEPVQQVRKALWIYGAGHVGRALVDVLTPLGQFEITWVDTGANRFPDTIPAGVAPLVATNPAEAVHHAPAGASHMIVTYSHAFDLEICHQLLRRDFGWAGLIGSDTKWARFRSRLGALGHGDAQISRICCPIGQKSLGKHPQAIAIGVAASLISSAAATNKAAMGDVE